MRLLALSAIGTAAAVSMALAAQTPARSPADVAGAVQRRYDTVRDFTAKFVHTYEGGVLRKKVTERGEVQIKKPGRMRWEYMNPEKKLFVADGSQIYSYIPADRQVIISPMPKTDQATTATLFLTGKGNLVRDFTVTNGELPSAPAGSTVLKLVPRQAERDYDTLLIAVNAGDQIQMLSAADRQGGRSTFTFSDIKENTGLTDKIFSFKIPRGADVVRSGSTPEGP
jgi:outer membrane lipoprotein carrier protein